MFQTIYKVHLRDRPRGKKHKVHWEYRLNPYYHHNHHHHHHHPHGKEKHPAAVVGITNLFILATAALDTMVPKDSTGVAHVHAAIEAISPRLAALTADIKAFDAEAIVHHLERLGEHLMQAGKNVSAAAAAPAVSDGEALAIIFYVKNALLQYSRETLLDLRKVRAKIWRARKLEDVAMALRDLSSFVIVLGAVLLSTTPGTRRIEGKEVLEGVVADIQQAAKYFES